MATLVLADSPVVGDLDRGRPAVSLSAWLKDGWAILFSHPDDFVRCELELDRWLTIMRRGFSAASIRPLALAKPTQPLDFGWVTQLTGDARTVLLEDPAGWRLHFADFHARRLREDVEAIGGRFVMVLDTTLRPRRVHTYSAPDRLPSPLDCVRWACALRDAGRVAAPHDETLSWDIPVARARRGWPEPFHSQSAA
jgi:hypothetical protein